MKLSILTLSLAGLLALAPLSLSAQRHHAPQRPPREVRYDKGKKPKKYKKDNGLHRGHYKKAKAPRRDPHALRCDKRGWYPGYRGRVRHRDGRWAYLRDNRWYYYDRFYEPDYYYRTPLLQFQTHRVSITIR